MDYQKIVRTSLFRRHEGPVDHLGQIHLFGLPLEDLVRQDRPDLGMVNETT